jgi:uncharacterized phage protein gp47/JayE
MPAYSIDDLTTPLTTDEVKASIYSVLAQVGTATTNWKPGAVVRTLITACAILIAALSRLMASIARSGFIEYASGRWLTLVALYVYGVTRIEATFASGVVTLTNTGGGSFNLDPGDLVVYNPTSGATYVNTAAIVLGPLATLNDVPILAQEAGSGSTSFAGEITGFQTPLLNVTVTNPAALVGVDEETDPALRARCYAKLGSLSSNGPRDAYNYWARSAVRLDGSPIGVTRTRVVTTSAAGTVDVYVATATGGVTGTANNPATDLGAIHDTIQRKAVPLSVTETTYSATPITVPVTYEAWLYNDSGLTEQQIRDAVAAELAAHFPEIPIGGDVIPPDSGKVLRADLEGVIRRAHHGDQHLKIKKVAITAPAADVSLASNEVPVLGAVTATAINQIPLPGGS